MDKELVAACDFMAAFASPYGEALCTHLPSRGVYSTECNTIRSIFPKSKKHPSFSVLIYTEDLTDVFVGLTRAVGEAPRQCTEDTDLVEFLKCNLYAGAEGHYAEAVRDALEDPLCIGITLGVGCVASMELPEGCRFQNPRWGSKVAAHARRLQAPRMLPGSLTLHELDLQRGAVAEGAIDVDALANSGVERRKWRTLSSLQYPIESIDVEDDDDDVEVVVQEPAAAAVVSGASSRGTPTPQNEEDHINCAAASAVEPDIGLAEGPSPSSSGPPVDASTDPPLEQASDNITLPGGAALSTSPVVAVPPPLPSVRLIELLHVDGCASLLKLRRYIDPVKRKPRHLLRKEEYNQARAAKKQAAKRQRPQAQQQGTAGGQTVVKRERQRKSYVIISDEPNVMTRRQRKVLEDAELESVSSSVQVKQSKSASATAKPSAAAQTFSQQQSAARDPYNGRFRPLNRVKQDAATMRRREERREQERSTTPNPRVFHMVDVPGKRSRTLLFAAKRKKRRSHKVVVID